MKNDYLITIDTVQTTDSGDDSFSLSTFGEYDYSKERAVIRYEDSAATGFEGCETVLNINENGVSMERTGAISSQLVLETGKKHMCHYMTPYGDLPLGVYTEDIKDNLSENGGTLDLHYTLDLNANFFALNHLKITVKEKN